MSVICRRILTTNGIASCSVILLSCLLNLLFVTFTAIPQEAILSFVLRPETVTLSPGATSSAQLVVSNNSVYEAEELEFGVTTEAEGLTVAPPPPLERLNPYSEQAVDFSISATADLPPGIYSLNVDAIYAYCIDVSCFQITEVLEFEVNVVEHPIVEAPETRRASGTIRTWLTPLLVVLAITGAVLLSRLIHTSLPLHLVLFLAVLGGLVYGIIQDQHEQARAIGSVLCTSCVGIEEARRVTPTLSSSARTALGRLQEDIELLVFHAPWCHSCPYAETMVEVMEKATEHLTYRLIDVEKYPDLAIRYGVVRSDRAVVPAIVRRDTGKVVFGVEDLEAHLLSLLGVTE
jgi:thiol-disulfide isomerase/thioredoxin